MLVYVRSTVTAALLLGGAVFSPAFAQSASDMAVRMGQIEEQMRMLIGQVEELTFQVQQLQSQLAQPGKTGAAPLAKKNRQAAVQPEPGLGQVEDQPLSMGGGEQIVTTVIKDDGTEEQVVINKAPGPKILGTLSSGAAATDDGGFQGQVLTPSDGQDQGGFASDPDAIETVALAPESPEVLYERSNESLLRRQFGDAESGFRSFIQKYPEHSLAGSAQYWLGETYFAQNDFRQAAQTFLKGYQQYPKSRRAADSLLKLGISLSRLGQKQQACAAYSAVSGEYPKAVEAKKRAQAEAKRAGCAA
ncbi:MAG: tol-pal system protein YbgF [Hyphomicrobiales bacterium]